MNTLHIDLGRTWRGGQNQVLLLLRALRARGHAAELIALQNSPMAEHAEAEGVRVHAVAPSFRRLGAAWQIRTLAAARGFNVLHCHEAHALTSGWLSGIQGVIPIVASRRVAYPLQTNSLSRARYQRADCILTISRFVQESVLASGLKASQCALIYSGGELPFLPSAEMRVRVRERMGLTKDDIALGCVGYLLPEKGQEELIR